MAEGYQLLFECIGALGTIFDLLADRHRGILDSRCDGDFRYWQ